LGQFNQEVNREALFKTGMELTNDNYDQDTKRGHLIDVVGIVKEGKLEFTWLYCRKQFEFDSIKSLADLMLSVLQSIIDSSYREIAYTTSDFPEADLSEDSFAKVLSKLTKKRGIK
ncbi:peptide synthetase, partial [Bacillus safensis]|nr:peptide synthetase [Bacillus safensis]